MLLCRAQQILYIVKTSTHLYFYKLVVAICRELKNLKQIKEVTDVESLDEIKINLYSKIKRRLGLQALLTTLRVNNNCCVNY